MARFGSSDGSGNPGDDPTQSIRYRQGGMPPPGPSPTPVGPTGQVPLPGSPGYQPGNAPTQYAAYNAFEQQPPAAPDDAGFAGPPPTPWFRRRSVLIAWIGLIAVMLTLVIWGVIQLTSRGAGGGSTAPETSSSSTTSTTSTTGSTTSSSASATSSATPSAAPPQQAPPKQPPAQQAPAPEPSHRYHLPSLPSVITIPPIPRVPELPTVITLPPHR